MKGLIILLGFIILVLQVRLLSSEGGVGEYLSLQTRLNQLQQEVQQQTNQNALLKQEVQDLQQGTQAIETIARQKLGMIGQDEIFVRVIEVPEVKITAESSELEPSKIAEKP